MNTTISILPASTVLNHFLGDDIEVHQAFYDSGHCDHWSWGDTLYSLVGNAELQTALAHFILEERGGKDTMTKEEQVAWDADYWDIVDDNYIALGE
jgi:hypothetical protein